MYDRVKLKSVRVYSEDTKMFGRTTTNHYLELIYEAENKYGVYEIIYPKVDLCLPNNNVPYVEKAYSAISINPTEPPLLKWSHVKLPLREANGTIKGRDGKEIEYHDVYQVIRTVKEKPVDMTLEEIEKKLGYKVKIVSEKK